MKVESCDGACCAVFPMWSTVEEFRESWETAPRDDLDVTGKNGLDTLMIADMLIPLDTEAAKERCVRFGVNPEYVDLYERDGMHGYTCKHWDEETRACGVYDARPDMCGAYPYARECFHCAETGGCANGPEWRKVSKEA